MEAFLRAAQAWTLGRPCWLVRDGDYQLLRARRASARLLGPLLLARLLLLRRLLLVLLLFLRAGFLARLLLVHLVGMALAVLLSHSGSSFKMMTRQHAPPWLHSRAVAQRPV